MKNKNNNQDEKNSTEFEKLKLLYEKNTDMFQYLLTWRQVMLGGYFAIIAALAVGFQWAVGSHTDRLFVFPLAGAWVSAIFWALSHRNGQLYELMNNVGAGLEEKMGTGVKGHFGGFTGRDVKMGHGKTLAVFYMGSGVVLLLCSICLLAGVRF